MNFQQARIEALLDTAADELEGWGGGRMPLDTFAALEAEGVLDPVGTTMNHIQNR